MNATMNATPTMNADTLDTATDHARRVRWLRQTATRRMSNESADYDALRAIHSSATSDALLSRRAQRSITRAMSQLGITRDVVNATLGDCRRRETDARSLAGAIHPPTRYHGRGFTLHATWTWLDETIEWSAPR